ncbi:cytotoxic and regulatory T-cell molecule [Gopherus flavomarginatus]|uniref:cytotoxic and regulatory T-cell molecule n=1 Tax=Gopherus flavomarginatus TaxID=286002 RepID=UPI0021CBDBBF|nr:cytotoxic and regulatory T-cell molecule [Gopherus flavomarginatus]
MFTSHNMTFTTVLCIMALLPLQGDFQEVHTESVTVEEGQDLSLQCDFTRDHESALEWSNPRGFVIFLKSHRGLKDQRYKLIHYSTNKLSISLSNVTVQDEGTYTCFYYDIPVKTKKVNVTVLAAPSKPQLEVSDIRTNGKEEKIVLSCLTKGSKPPPQITWLLNNGLEVYGDIKHQFEHDGKKCNTTSSLMVHAYNRDSTASCVIRHETLRGGKLTVSFQFENFMTTTGSAPNVLEVSTRTSEHPQHYMESRKATLKSIIQTSPVSISLATSIQQEVFSSQTTGVIATESNPNANTIFSQNPLHSTVNIPLGSSQPNFPATVPERPSSTSLPAIPTQQRELPANTTNSSEVTRTVNEYISSTEAPATSSEPATQNANSTIEPERTLNVTEETSVTDVPAISNEQSIQNSNITTGSEMTLNVTVAEETSVTEEPSISHEETTVNCKATIKTDLNSEGIRQRQTSVLLPVLVAVLIFVMLIIVLLFMRKLQKAHGAWKRENDTSEQTLESYKSRSNEENPAPEKNGQVANQKPTMQYVTEGYAGTIKSNSEERYVSTFEKHLAYGKETDV